MGTISRLKNGLFVLFAAVFCFATMQATLSIAEDSEEPVCAKVKIEIRQELTLERQAFDAHMRINNGLSDIDLINLKVDIIFTDEEGNSVVATTSTIPDDTTSGACFFIRKDSDNITLLADDTWKLDNVTPSTSSDFHWLIIPVPGSAGDDPEGKLYFVGARLTYQMGANGEEHIVEVRPDSISVKPLPELTLDSFLKYWVYGDDPLTEDVVEPLIPFTLGTRVKNTGNSTAYNLKIESAQPKIVDNEKDLLVTFTIIGSEVNGVVTENSLMVDLGNIAPGEAAIGRWLMTSSLVGEFTEFDATVSHAEALGGQVTSIMNSDGIKTWSLIKDVLVDLPGRDQIRDFLALTFDNPQVLKVCESEDVNGVWDSDVVDLTGDASVSFNDTSSGDDTTYKLQFSSSSPFVYVRVADPFEEEKIIKEVIRSDGKHIKSDNAWLCKERNDDKEWEYFFNLFDFDFNSTEDYTVVFDTSIANDPPNFVDLDEQIGTEDELLEFTVSATDPEGETLTLSVSNLPEGADFIDNGDGTGIFSWTPAIGQAGDYAPVFRASDGHTTVVMIVPVEIRSINDTDGDGMDDDWEKEYFNDSLERDGTGDFDSDGILDLDEYLNGTDPTREDYGPSPPLIVSPAEGQDVTVLSPVLTIDNSTDPDGDTLTYDFEVFSDLQLTDRVAAAHGMAEGVDTTAWSVTGDLDDNTLYYWRVRSCDYAASSIWTYGTFFVNTANEAPGVFNISRPADGSYVDTLTPVLEVTNSSDVDQNVLTYKFEVYVHSDLTGLVASVTDKSAGTSGTTAWTVDTNLTDETTYYWKSVAVDPDGLETSTTGSFTVSTANQAPSAPAIDAPAVGERVIVHQLDIVVTNAVDPEGNTLVYDFQLDTVNTFDSSNLVTAADIPEGTASTAWYVTDLFSNTTYFWRARAFDGAAYSPWVTGNFLVNPINQAPQTPTLNNPGHTAWVQSLTPELAVNPAIDPDGDDLNYYFELYSDSEFEDLVFEGSSAQPSFVVPSELDDNTRYFWRALAEDPDGEVSEWMEDAQFFVRAYGSGSDDLTVNVTTSNETPVVDVPVYAFTASGSYTGLKSQTDDDGDALFVPDDFASGDYQFRVDYMGSQFWTETISMPETTLVEKSIEVETVEVTVSTATGVVEGAPVYLFTADKSYLDLDEVTDVDGMADFILPVEEDFVFRADILSSQYWSDVTTVSVGATNEVAVEAGGGEWTLYVLKDAFWPMEEINTYLFKDNGAYLNKNETTDVSGAVLYNVPEGVYKVRADYLGYQFWTEDTTVDDDITLDLDIAHQDVVIDVVGMYQGTADPLEDLSVYLFTEAGAYMNLNQNTDVDGQALFNLPEQAYKVRADFLNRQYWSEIFTWEDRTIEIPMAEVEITVVDGVPITDVPVYVFNEAGAYLNITGTTDTDGTVSFRIPAGLYKFRADYQTHQFWSGTAQLTADQENPVTIYTGGGLFSLTVTKDGTLPVFGENCYVFNEIGTYIGLTGVTDSCGQVGFDLSDGIYNFRLDYLGYQFWSGFLTVPEALSEAMIIPHQDTIVTVNSVYQDTIEPLVEIKTYLFTDLDIYMNQSPVTDVNGQVAFDLPEQPYKVRADYLGRQYWSEAFTWQEKTIEIPTAEAEITVAGNGQTLEGIPVYVFNEDEDYLNITDITDMDGQVSFRLPAGDYKFRADHQGSNYWSEIVGLTADQVNTIDISTGGGTFNLTVLKSATESLVGAGCYLFGSSGNYLNLSAVTSSEGQVSFDVADGDYKVRVDYLGYQFWTETFTVPDTLSKVLTLPHQNVTITVTREYQAQTPLEGVPVYLFKPSGTYMNQRLSTDVNGQAVFYLPDQAYKVRANYLGNQFWSADFQATDTAVTIDHNLVKVHVHRSGTDVVGAVVYLFTGSGSYLSTNQATDSTGMVDFLLPERDFKFRADQGSDKVYSTVISVQTGPEQVVEIDLD